MRPQLIARTPGTDRPPVRSPLVQHFLRAECTTRPPDRQGKRKAVSCGQVGRLGERMRDGSGVPASKGIVLVSTQTRLWAGESAHGCEGGVTRQAARLDGNRWIARITALSMGVGCRMGGEDGAKRECWQYEISGLSGYTKG